MNKAITDKIDEIASQLFSYIDEDQIGILSIMSGQFGLLPFMGLYLQYRDNAEYTERFFKYLEKSVEKLSDSFYLPTYANGLPGIMDCLRVMNEQTQIEVDYLELEEVYKSYLCRQMVMNYASENFDFLHGALGISYYYVNEKNFIEKSVAALAESAIPCEAGLKWKCIINNEQNVWGYNISLSHGMSSIILYLCRIYDSGIASGTIKELLEKAMGFILSQRIDPGKYGSYFPSMSLENMVLNERSRLAWCYGDLGVAIAIWHAGKATGNSHWRDLAIEIMHFSAQRKELQYALVVDAGLCHGSAGIAMMFQYMYKQTSDESFKEAWHYWVLVTLEMANFKDGPAGYKKYSPQNPDPWVADYGFLTGIAGIGLVLLSTLDERYFKGWPRMLMLFDA